jgi:P4 family phage/plasmid primase-like protien
MMMELGGFDPLNPKFDLIKTSPVKEGPRPDPQPKPSSSPGSNGAKSKKTQKPRTMDPKVIDAVDEFFKTAGAGAPLEEKATEEELALQLFSVLAPVDCRGQTWRRYKAGCWIEIEAETLGAAALAVIAPTHRTARKAEQVIKHLAMILNGKPERNFATFVVQEGSRTLLCLKNTVLAVSAGEIEILPHSATYNFTKQIQTPWDPAAECPTFLRVLKETLPDLADRTLFLLFCGYALMKDCRFQVCLLMVGLAGTGKSTLLEAIAAVLGPDLVSGIGLSKLCDLKTFALPTLKEKALNMATELDTKEIEGSSIFKALVCGETVPDRGMYKGYQEMRTHCKLIFASNTAPYFARCTDAELRRLRILACNQLVAQRDLLIDAKLALERPGILRLMVDAFQQLPSLDAMPQGGPQSRELTEQYSQTATPVQTFWNERCELEPTGVIPMRDTYSEYLKWAQDLGHTYDLKAFHKEFRRICPQLKKSRRRISGTVTWCYTGFQFTPELV